MDANDREAIQTLTKKVDKVLFYLESDPTTNTKGLVEGLQMLKDRVSVLEDDKKKIKAKISVIAACWGFIAIIGKELWGRIFPMH